MKEAQVRVVYALLRPAVRAAARFGVPVRTVLDLVRLASCEELSRAGASQTEIAQRLGVTTRHVRSFLQRLRSDFFQAEREVGLLRAVEDVVAMKRPTAEALVSAFPDTEVRDVRAAIEALVAEGRVEMVPDGRLAPTGRYAVLTSEAFHHRIDALNHFLDAAFRAVLQRLVLDEKEAAMIKTITFTAAPEELVAWVRRLEGDLRRDVAALEESATFHGPPAVRYTIGLSLASVSPDEPG